MEEHLQHGSPFPPLCHPASSEPLAERRGAGRRRDGAAREGVNAEEAARRGREVADGDRCEADGEVEKVGTETRRVAGREGVGDNRAQLI